MERKIRGEVKNKRTKLVDVVPLSQPYVIMVDPCDACNFKCNFCPTNISKENLKQLSLKPGLLENSWILTLASLMPLS